MLRKRCANLTSMEALAWIRDGQIDPLRDWLSQIDAKENPDVQISALAFDWELA